MTSPHSGTRSMACCVVEVRLHLLETLFRLLPSLHLSSRKRRSGTRFGVLAEFVGAEALGSEGVGWRARGTRIHCVPLRRY